MVNDILYITLRLINECYNYFQTCFNAYLKLKFIFFESACGDQDPPLTLGNASPRQNFTGYRELDIIIFDCPPKRSTLMGEFFTEMQCLPQLNWQMILSNETYEEMNERFNCTDGE